MGSPSPDDPHSSFRLEISVSVGYQRRRATVGGAFEGHAVTFLLLVSGVAFVLLFVVELFRLLRTL